MSLDKPIIIYAGNQKSPNIKGIFIGIGILAASGGIIYYVVNSKRKVKTPQPQTSNPVADIEEVQDKVKEVDDLQQDNIDTGEKAIIAISKGEISSALEYVNRIIENSFDARDKLCDADKHLELSRYKIIQNDFARIKNGVWITDIEFKNYCVKTYGKDFALNSRKKLDAFQVEFNKNSSKIAQRKTEILNLRAEYRTWYKANILELEAKYVEYRVKDIPDVESRTKVLKQIPSKYQ